MKRLLITGARGFLGGRLVRRLANEGCFELTAVTSLAEYLDVPANVLVEHTDLLDLRAIDALMRRVCPEVCVHLAWGQKESNYRNALSNYQWLAASISLFAQFQAMGGEQFLFAGSSGEYEDQMGGSSETQQLRQMSLYGRCKKTASELFLTSGSDMQVQVARCFTIYGPGDTHPFGAIPAAILALMKGETFICENPRALRDYIYIDDAAEAIVRLLKSDYSGAFDIGSGIPRCMRDVFSEIANQLNCPERVFYRGDSGVETVLTADNTFLREMLQMSECISFPEGIRRSIAYWRTQLGAE